MMIRFNRYPHVRDFVLHYASELKNDGIQELLGASVKSREDAFLLSRFVWVMINEMAKDCESETVVLGRIDNSSLIPDIDYEIGVYLNERGYGVVWDKVCDES